jgi:hypothetical protein
MCIVAMSKVVPVRTLNATALIITDRQCLLRD